MQSTCFCPSVLFPKKRTPSGRQMFTKEEDLYLKFLVSKFGTNQWSLVASMIGNRTARQCRERYKNYLSPTINADPWTCEEDQLLIAKYESVGPKWSQLAAFFNGRTDVAVKNRYNMLISKGLTTSSSTGTSTTATSSSISSPLSSSLETSPCECSSATNNDNTLTNPLIKVVKLVEDTQKSVNNTNDAATNSSTTLMNVRKTSNAVAADPDDNISIWFEEFDLATYQISNDELFMTAF